MFHFNLFLALIVLSVFSICIGKSISLSESLRVTFTIISVTGSEDEERLVRDLFRGYNKLIRPVQNMTQKVDVRFGLAFVQLINVVRMKKILLNINFIENGNHLFF